MSFMRALATVAMGFAAAKGIDQYKKMGGMAGLQDMMKGAGGASGMAAGMGDQIGAMAERMGIPGGSKAMNDMMASFGGRSSSAMEAGQAGLAGLMSAMQGAMAGAGKSADDMFGAMTQGNPMSAAMEDNAKLMIRAMIQAAKADGEIDAGEQKVILEHLEDASPDEQAFVREQLAAPLDIQGLANDTGDMIKGQVYSLSLTAIKVDNPAEVAYLRHLSAALGLSNQARDAIHASMGLPPLPPG